MVEIDGEIIFNELSVIVGHVHFRSCGGSLVCTALGNWKIFRGNGNIGCCYFYLAMSSSSILVSPKRSFRAALVLVGNFWTNLRNLVKELYLL